MPGRIAKTNAEHLLEIIVKGKEDTIAGIGFICLALFFLINAWALPKGSDDGVPGPGYFPLILSALLIVLSLVMILTGIVKKTSFNFVDDLFRANAVPFLLTILAIVVYLALWSLIPFVINTGGFLFVLGLIYRRTLLANVLFSSVTTGAIYGVFSNLFHVML